MSMVIARFEMQSGTPNVPLMIPVEGCAAPKNVPPGLVCMAIAEHLSRILLVVEEDLFVASGHIHRMHHGDIGTYWLDYRDFPAAKPNPLQKRK